MTPGQKNLVRLGLVALAGGLFVAFPILWFPVTAFVGFEAYKFLFDPGGSPSNRAERRAENRMLRQERKMDRSLRREKRRVYREHFSNIRGWKAESFPPGMVANIKGLHDASITLDAAGIKGLVTAKRDGLFTRDKSDTERVMFSFPLQRESQAEEVKAMLSQNGVDAKLVHGKDGVYRIFTRDADLCSALVKQVWPQEELSFKREVVNTRQYIVEGCASFEEAKAKFEKDRDLYNPVNSFTTLRTQLGDKPAQEDSSGRLLDKANIVSMPTGAYVITESTATADSALIRIPADVRHPDDMMSFACKQFENNLVERKQGRAETTLFDGTPEGVTYGAAGKAPEIVLGGREFDAMAAMTRMGAEGDLHAWVVVDSVDAIKNMATTGEIPGGTLLSLGTFPPVSGPGKMVVSVPIDSVEKLMHIGSADGERTGIGTFADLHDRVRSEEAVTVRVSGGLSIANARVDGYLFSPVGERVCNDRLDVIGIDRLKDWMQDASEIQSVTYTLDTTREEMRITTTVGGVARTEKLPLSQEAIRNLEYRGVISKTELKDFVMQTHPDYFRTYAAGRFNSDGSRKSIYKDPVRDFLKGVRAERRSSAPLSLETGLRESRSNARKAAAVQAPGKKNGRGVTMH